MAKDNKNIYGIAGLTSYVKPDNNGKIDKESELANFLEGYTEKDKLKDIIDKIPSGGGTPGPDSVGSEEIKNDSIKAEDINHEEFADDNDIESLFN